MIFTADYVTCYDKNNDVFSSIAPASPPMPGLTITWKGAYTYNDTQLIIHHAPPSVLNVPYEFKNDKLDLGSHPYNKIK
jgi:hypothetical protein